MNIEYKYFEKNDMTWFCLSVFYSRENFDCLLPEVNQFYENNTLLIEHFSIYMSDMQGNRLNIAIASNKYAKKYTYSLINNYFSDYLLKKPSNNIKTISKEESLWGYYNNNSIEWNCFQLPKFLSIDRLVLDFSLYTSLLILKLYDQKSCYLDNILALNFLLTVKAYKLYTQNTNSEYIIRENYHNDTNNNIIEHYWDFVPDNNFEILKAWNNCIIAIFNLYGKQIGLNLIYGIIFKQLGSNDIIKRKIIDLINKWAKMVKREEIDMY